MKWVLPVAVAVLAAILVAVMRRSGNRSAQPIDDAARGGAGPDEADDARMRELHATFAPWKRVAFDPVTEASDSDASVSKFGGAPWLPRGTGWPVCPGCRTPMHFFAQLDIESLPEESGVVGTGLIQLFMCTGTEGRSDVCYQTWEHGAASQVVRRVDPTQPGANSQEHAKSRTWPARRIVDWKPLDDWPDWGDWKDVGLEVSDELEAIFEKAEESDTAPSTNGRDKVGGWPLWVQSPEWGRCRECGTRMHLVLQLDSEDNIPFMFGDAGVGHISQCPKHPARLTWGWACH